MDKGEAFEIKIKNALQNELQRGVLGIDSTCAKIFLRKSYWSRDREKAIVIDVSLELFRQGALEPYFIWAWECKDYARSVPVDDIEEFHSKLEQIGLHRIKGTVACRNAFQESAVKYAKAKGIGLAYFRRSNIIRLMESHRSPTVADSTVVFGLTHPDSEELESVFYGFTSNGHAVLRVSELIQGELVHAA